LAFSPDSSRLAISCETTVTLWDMASGRQSGSLKWPPAEPPYSNITSLTHSPDGRQLAVGRGSDGIRLWDTATGREIRGLQGHTGAVSRLAYSPDGRRLASASADRTVKLWDLATGNEVLTLTGSGGFTGLAFVSGDTGLAAACGDDVRIWDATPLREPPAP
jgi:WD40 repeat protein